MTAVQATLKTMVQCRSLWFWHAVGLLIFTPTVLRTTFNPEFRRGAIVAVLIWPLWSGVVYSSLFKDVMTKPFSFGIPAHTLQWRKSVFIVGLIVAAAGALLFVSIRGVTPVSVILTVCQVFMLCLTAYLAGILAATAVSNTSPMPALVSLLAVISLDNGVAEDFRVSASQLLLSHPVLVTVFCGSAAYATWRWLGSPGLPRRFCDLPFLPLHTMINTRAQYEYARRRKIRQMRKAPGAAMKWTERFILVRMKRLPARTTRKSLWGTMFTIIGRVAPARMSNLIWAVIGLVTLTLVLGFYHPKRFYPDFSGANLVLYLLCVLASEHHVNPHAAMLLNVSRKNRFRSLLLGAVVQYAATTVVSAVVIFISIAAGGFLDEITLFGGMRTYTAINPKSFFIFAPMLPFFYLTQVLFTQRTVPATLVIAIAGILSFFAAANHLLATPAWELLLLQVASWLPFVTLIRHYCYTWDLNLDRK